MNKKLPVCDFCGVEDSDKNPVISGDKANICKVCAKSAYDIICEHEGDSDKIEKLPTHTSSESKNILLKPKGFKCCCL